MAESAGEPEAGGVVDLLGEVVELDSGATIPILAYLRDRVETVRRDEADTCLAGPCPAGRFYSFPVDADDVRAAGWEPRT